MLNCSFICRLTTSEVTVAIKPSVPIEYNFILKPPFSLSDLIHIVGESSR